MTSKPIPDGYATVTPWLISRDTPGSSPTRPMRSAPSNSAASPAPTGASSTLKFASATPW
jgi:hypothetical protein